MSRPVAPAPRHRWFAAAYDTLAKMDEERARSIRRFMAGGAAGRVLELGCGTGLNLEHYDFTQVENLEATEPDIHMLRRAEAKVFALPPEARSRVRLQEVPAESLPFPDGTFDT